MNQKTGPEELSESFKEFASQVKEALSNISTGLEGKSCTVSCIALCLVLSDCYATGYVKGGMTKEEFLALVNIRVRDGIDKIDWNELEMRSDG